MNSNVFFLVTNIRTNVQKDSSEFEGLIQEMVSQKLFSNKDICHIDLNGEKSICTVSTYIKQYLSILEIENKICHRYSNMKPHFEVISDKLIMILVVLTKFNSSRQINHSKYTTLTKDTFIFDVMLQNYFEH